MQQDAINPNPFDLTGRVALVTGSTRGLGLATARCLAHQGATVAVNGRDPDTVAARCSDLAAAGARAIPACFDVADEAAMAEAIAGIVAQEGSIDILVANAAHWLVRPLEDTTRDDLLEIFTTKLGSAFSGARLVAPHMKARRWGRLIMVAGISVAATSGASPADTASQGALVALTKALSAKLAGHGITCNAVAPGYFRTDMSRALQDSESFNTWLAERAPARRWGKPEEIGWTVAFLASEGAAYITGQTILADGGLSTSL
jgi:gluconate 5-dehydrogenase